MAEFECRLKKYRQLKDLTQEQLAAQVGVRRETIMRLEKAQYNPSLKLAVDISGRWGPPLRRSFFSHDAAGFPSSPAALEAWGGTSPKKANFLVTKGLARGLIL